MGDRGGCESSARDLASAIVAMARRQPDHVALQDAGSDLAVSYAELARRVGRFATQLRAAGVLFGEPVALRGTNSVDFAVALLGTMASGAVAMPLNPELPEGVVASLREHAGVRVTLGADPGSCALPLDAWREGGPCATTLEPVHPTAGALLIYTSGTTGDPKGVLLTHEALCANARTAATVLRMGPEHRTLALLPLFHTFALVSDLLPMLLSGGSSVIAPAFDVRSLPQVETAIHRKGVCSFSAVPLIFDLMNGLGADLKGPRMRFCVSGAAPLEERTRTRFEALQGFPILPAYGMTEACCFISITGPGAVVPGSAGRPIGELRILDTDGSDRAAGETGEIVIRGPNVIRDGYHRDDRPCYVDGDWFRTGDLGTLDPDGNLFVTGRIKNMVIRGGEKIYLDDIDRCLKRHHGVADARSVGIFDEVPERIVTFVVPSEGVTHVGDLGDWVATHAGRGSTPDEIRLIEAIPYTKTGKARIAALQALAGGAP